MFILNRIVWLFNWFAVIALLLSYGATFVSPLTSTIPSFFGLIFPVLFLVNLAFVFYWFIFKKFNMLYSGIVLFIGLPYFNRCFNFYSSNPSIPAHKEQTKIMSYNVRLFDLYNWTENNKTKNKIFTLLREADADIYCFQEFFHQEYSNDFVTRDTLVKFLRAKHFTEAYTHKLRMEQFFGLAIFSAYPILRSGHIDFTNDPNNNALWADVKRKNDTLRIYNIHLSSIRFQKSDYEALGEEPGPGRKNNVSEQKIFSRLSNAFQKRVLQTNTVLEHVKKSPYPVILCGDFNDTPVSYCYTSFANKLNDAFTESGFGWGSTYTGRLPFLRIDYIWHSDKLNARNFKVGNQILSDHYPVSCTIY